MTEPEDAGGGARPAVHRLRVAWQRRRGRSLRQVTRWLRARARSLAGSWRRSLRVRISATTLVVGTIALALLGALLSGQVRDSLWENRTDQVLNDAASRSQTAQRLFNNTPSQPQDVQQAAYDGLQALQSTSTGDVGVMLLGSSGEPNQIPDFVSDGALRPLVSAELRQAVLQQRSQMWQPVSIDTADGPVPGIVVGSIVTLPLAGDYQLYFVYSLAEEQATLDLLQNVLTGGGIVLMVLLLVMAWYVTRQVLTPVQVAANTARRLSDGLLDERMKVRGVDELAVLATSFNEMAQSLQDQIERLAHLSQMQQQFVSDVSHELRTPLTTIRMASEVLHSSRAEFGPVQARSAELLAAQLDRFEALLADLLEISRFDAGAAMLDVEEMDLRVVVEQVLEANAPLAEAHNTPLLRDFSDAPVRVELDSRRVQRILRNLVSNAIEHGEAKPIDVIVRRNKRAASVLVRDHGIGMTPQEAERVFDRFWRADPARARTIGGTGLGLAISLEDAHLHGGSLQAWGSPGSGATFRLTLPLRAGLEITDHPLALHPTQPAGKPQTPNDPAGPQALPDDFLAQVSD